MRLAPALFLFLFCGPATAQPCDPASVGEGEVCPDTTDWHRYAPLAVGNVWQYQASSRFGPPYEHGTELIGETEIDGEAYVLALRCEREGFDGSGTVVCDAPFPVRYDEDARAVLRRVEDAQGTPSFELYHASDYLPFIVSAVPCPLDAAFSEPDARDCGAFGSGVYGVSGAYGVGFEGLGDTEKVFGDMSGTVTSVAGVGAVGSENKEVGDFSETLVYARVGEEEIGEALFEFPVAGEGEAPVPAASGFTAVFPNPAHEAVTVQYVLDAPQTVTLEVVDLLGRRVRTVEAGRQAAGPHAVSVGVAGLPAGPYLLRLRGDAGAEAVRRVAVVH